MANAAGLLPVFLNGNARPLLEDASRDIPLSEIRSFHAALPGYAPTPLRELPPETAAQLGVRAVLVKDESARLGLPAFKILGASWGAYRAINALLAADPDPDPAAATNTNTTNTTATPLSWEETAARAAERGVRLFAASEGNHGRALAAVARMMGLRSRIYMPAGVTGDAARLVASEGADVRVSELDYDGAVGEAAEAAAAAAGAAEGPALLVQDCAFEGYAEIPRWIVEGYTTMLSEVDEQLLARRDGLDAVAESAAATAAAPGLVVCPVGVGSLAHAVVRYCKSAARAGGPLRAVASVEPASAPCLSLSLQRGGPASVRTGRTIMDGLNCGTVSADAYGDLEAGVDACVCVDDEEAHRAVGDLADQGIDSGPCGAATLAALRKLAEEGNRPAWLTGDTVVVLLNTEGSREY